MLITCLLLVAACGAPPEDDTDSTKVTAADLVLRGGTVASVDSSIGRAQAIAVNGTTITAIGSDSEIAPYIGPDTVVIELDGRLVTPGFIEGHGHFLGFGEALQILDFSAVRNWGEIVSMVASAADKARPAPT